MINYRLVNDRYNLDQCTIIDGEQLIAQSKGFEIIIFMFIDDFPQKKKQNIQKKISQNDLQKAFGSFESTNSVIFHIIYLIYDK